MKVRPIKVNADYESVLFENKPQPKINSASEFLAFFLEKTPFLSHTNYSNEYLDYVESVSGHRPSFVTQGQAQLWWGELKDLEKERFLNSKLTSTEFFLSQHWDKDSMILSQDSDLEFLPKLETPYIAKNPFEMSGRGFRLFSKGIGDAEVLILKNMMKKHPVILEPLRKRIFDFSHFVFPSGKLIGYQNLVDQNFQYKGTFFKDWNSSNLEDFTFHKQLPVEKWDVFQRQIEVIRAHYDKLTKTAELAFGFSIDSFIYTEDDELHIHPLCEVNFRRTMGRVAYDLSERYAESHQSTGLIFLPPLNDSLNKCRNFEGSGQCLHLSPEGARFTILFLTAENENEFLKLKNELAHLLSLSELAVRI